MTMTQTPRKRTPEAVLDRAEKIANDALVAKIEEIKIDLHALTETDIKRRWVLGCKIHAIMTDATGTYGTDPATMVKALLPLSRDSLRPMVVMAERYDETDIDTIINLRHPRTNEGLTWSHVMALSRVRDKDRAMDMAAKAVNGCWSTKDLVREVVRSSGGPQSAGGRKNKKVANLPAAVDDIIDRTTTWCNVATERWLAEG
jgi:hypothetical protein